MSKQVGFGCWHCLAKPAWKKRARDGPRQIQGLTTIQRPLAALQKTLAVVASK